MEIHTWQKAERVLHGAMLSLRQDANVELEFPEGPPPSPEAWQKEETTLRDKIDAIVRD